MVDIWDQSRSGVGKPTAIWVVGTAKSEVANPFPGLFPGLVSMFERIFKVR